MADVDEVCKRKDELMKSCHDACVSFCLSHKLQRYFLRLNDRDSLTVDTDDNYTLSKNKQLQVEKQILYEEPEPIDYKRALKVIEVELAFLYDVFFHGQRIPSLLSSKNS